MDLSFLSSPPFQGAQDLAGRLGNGMQGASGQQGSYDPAQPGLAGIKYSAQQIAGAPVKLNSNARLVPGGGRLAGLGPGTPAQGAQPAAPMLSPGGYPNGSGVPF